MNDEDARHTIASVVWPTVLIAFVGLVGYLKLSAPLQSVRPRPPASGSGSVVNSVADPHVVAARLWEDPFRFRVSISKPQKTRGSITERFDWSHDCLVLPVVLRGASTPVESEWRMRTRYAVISALSVCRYRPSSSDKLHHAFLGQACDLPIPYEVFEPDITDRLYDEEDEAANKKVLVLWVDEDQLGDKPQARLTAILLAISEDSRVPPQEPFVPVLGPASTDGLIRLVMESRQSTTNASPTTQDRSPETGDASDVSRESRPALQFHYYSCRATIEPAALKYLNLDMDVRNALETLIRGRTDVQDVNEGGDVRIPFTSIIGTDLHLAHALRKELELRDRWPDRFKDDECIILLTEKDTSYGRAIPKLFSTVYDQRQNCALLKDLKLYVSGNDWKRLFVSFSLKQGEEVRDDQEVNSRAAESLLGLGKGLSETSFVLEVVGGDPPKRVRLPDTLMVQRADSLDELRSQIESKPSNATWVVGKWHTPVIAESAHADDGGSGIEETDPQEDEEASEQIERGSDVENWLYWDTAITAGDRTLYGRISVRMRPSRDRYAAHWQLTRPFRVYEYLRGVDGTPSLTSQATDKLQRGTAASLQQQAPADQVDFLAGFAPTGDSQLDYLRRLQSHLVDVDRQMKARGGEGIRAIGVMGTDVYDKLLVLRAMRPYFPDCVFFTTDLNAEMFRPSEVNYTQNLVVASHFGLQLHPSLQRDVPPFRDSYQTAAFLAALAAVGDGRIHDVCDPLENPGGPDAEGNNIRQLWPSPVRGKSDYTTNEVDNLLYKSPYEPLKMDEQGVTRKAKTRRFLRPLVFEIGCGGAYQLTLVRNGTESTRTCRVSLPASPGDQVLAVSLVDASSVTRLDLHDHPLSGLIHAPSPREVSPRNTWEMAVVAFIGVLGLISLAYFSKPVSHGCHMIATDLWSLVRWFGQCVQSAVRAAGRVALPPARYTFLWIRRRLNVKYQASGRPSPPSLDSTSQIPKQFSAGSDLQPAPWRGGLYLLVVILVLWLGRTICDQHWGREQGEPFAWASGISVWPTVIIRWLTAIIGISLLWRATSELQTNSAAFVQNDVSQRRPSDGKFAWWRELVRSKLFSGLNNADDILVVYQSHGGRLIRFLRASVFMVLFVVGWGFIFKLTDSFPNTPARNNTAWWWAKASLWSAVPISVILSILVIDAFDMCRRMAEALCSEKVCWSSPTLQRVLKDAHFKDDTVETLLAVREWAAIRVIASASAAVSKTILSPFICLLLLIIARQRLIDGWNVPTTLLLLVAILGGVLIIQALRLRHVARERRDATLRTLRAQKIGKELDEAAQRRLDLVIKEIKGETRGAFGPFAQDYLLRAIAIPFGGTGVLALLEYFWLTV